MSRDISTTNLAEIDAAHYSPVILAKLEFSDPVHVHTDIGSLTFSGDEYIGVGNLGSVNVIPESSDLQPSQLQLQLSGIEDQYVLNALEQGQYGDRVTLYLGYRNNGGALVDAPLTLWRGKFQFSDIVQDEGDNSVVVTVQHDLASIDDIEGGRFSHEDQTSRFAGDDAFEYIHLMATRNVVWGGGRVSGEPGRRSVIDTVEQ